MPTIPILQFERDRAPGVASIAGKRRPITQAGYRPRGEARFKVNARAWNTCRLMVAAAAVAALAASFTPPAGQLETLLLAWGSRFMPTAQAPA